MNNIELNNLKFYVILLIILTILIRSNFLSES